jgi:hypothetical protein
MNIHILHSFNSMLSQIFHSHSIGFLPLQSILRSAENFTLIRLQSPTSSAFAIRQRHLHNLFQWQAIAICYTTAHPNSRDDSNHKRSQSPILSLFNISWPVARLTSLMIYFIAVAAVLSLPQTVTVNSTSSIWARPQLEKTFSKLEWLRILDGDYGSTIEIAQTPIVGYWEYTL